MLDRVIARIKTIKEKYHHHFPYKSRNWSRQKPTFPHVHHFYNTVQHSSQWNSFLMKEGRVKPCCWEIYIVVQYSIVDQPQRKCSRSPCSFQIYWICWTCGGENAIIHSRKNAAVFGNCTLSKDFKRCVSRSKERQGMHPRGPTCLPISSMPCQRYSCEEMQCSNLSLHHRHPQFLGIQTQLVE